MGDAPAKTRKKSRILAGLRVALQVFIVICLVDGFLDIVYPLLKSANTAILQSGLTRVAAGPVEPGSVEDKITPFPTLPVRRLAGAGEAVTAFHAPGINVAADGLRSNGQPVPAAPRAEGLLLGSSTAFGYGIADTQTLSAHLERALDGVRIKNYATPFQTMAETTLRWFDLQNTNGKPDFVLIGATAIQLYKDCRTISVAENRNILLYLWGRIVQSLSKVKPSQIAYCETPEGQDLAVQSSLMAMEQAISFGRAQGIPFYIVNLPSIFDDNVKVDYLMGSEKFRALYEKLRPMYQRYRAELLKRNFPEIIDLVGVLPSDRKFFIDTDSHLSSEGNRIVAEKLAERLQALKK